MESGIRENVTPAMLCVLTGAYIASGKVRQELIRDLADTYTSDDKVVTALGFSSREESARVLEELIEQYAFGLAGSMAPNAPWPYSP